MSTHNIPFFIIKKKITTDYPKSAARGFYSKGLKKEFETAVINETSVFEPLKFYCICISLRRIPCLYLILGPFETLRDIRTLTYQMCRIEENTNGTSKFHKWTCTLSPLVRNIC